MKRARDLGEQLAITFVSELQGQQQRYIEYLERLVLNRPEQCLCGDGPLVGYFKCATTRCGRLVDYADACDFCPVAPLFCAFCREPPLLHHQECRTCHKIFCLAHEGRDGICEVCRHEQDGSSDE